MPDISEAKEDLTEARKELQSDFLWFETLFAAVPSMLERDGFEQVWSDMDIQITWCSCLHRLCDISINLEKILKRFDEQNPVKQE